MMMILHEPFLTIVSLILHEPFLTIVVVVAHITAAALHRTHESAAHSEVSTVFRSIGGAELNSSVAITRLGKKARWASVLPDTNLGRLISSKAMQIGVELALKKVADPHSEVGMLHVVDGRSPDYQRLNSAFSKLDPGDIDWPAVLGPNAEQSCKWLHMTGITPMLGEGPAVAWVKGVEAAHRQAILTPLPTN
jgi:2-dehydro-3-deoxygluconokinase